MEGKRLGSARDLSDENIGGKGGMWQSFIYIPFHAGHLGAFSNTANKQAYQAISSRKPHSPSPPEQSKNATISVYQRRKHSPTVFLYCRNIWAYSPEDILWANQSTSHSPDLSTRPQRKISWILRIRKSLRKTAGVKYFGDSSMGWVV